MIKLHKTSAGSRRRSARLSVSLRHDDSMTGSSSSSSLGPVEGKAKEEAITSSRIARPSHTSNDSGDSSGVRDWFERSNNHPATSAIADYQNSEPPYYCRQNSSNDSNDRRNDISRGVMPRKRLHGSVIPQPQEVETPGSSSSGYRSVIDDLTTKNKRLKERLRRLEAAARRKDTLAEVRVHHSFPAHKRKAMDDLMRNLVFEASSHSSKEDLSTGASGDDSQNPSSNSTLNSRPFDSGYASMSRSATKSTPNLDRPRLATGQTFLSPPRGTPAGFLPHHHLVQREKQKKEMVVRRLEELFTGKRAGPARLLKSMQMEQQEVSNSAARDDRQRNNGQSSAEGVREAHIQPYDMDVDVSGPEKDASDQFSSPEKTSKNSPPSTDDDESLEQRPTRPLDLDPDRAQVPSDNVDYIRHLGLSTPQLVLQDSIDAEADAEGWTFLNLLVNMAQLHTMNVTLDFVRSAVADVSDKFQVSLDGKKLRWRGGTHGTRLASESGSIVSSARNLSPQESDSLDGLSRKRRKTTAGRFAAVPLDKSNRSVSERKSIIYRPIFNHRTSSSSSSSENMSSFNSSTGSSLIGESNRDRNSQMGTSLETRHRRHHENGAIVYYRGAPFCTDLSKDPLLFEDPPTESSNPTSYVLGSDSVSRSSISRTPSGSFSPARPLQEYSKILPYSRTSDMVEDDEVDLCFSPGWSLEQIVPYRKPLPLMASGLGGTQPADHFTLEVETQRTILNEHRRASAATFGLTLDRALQKLSQSSLASIRDSSRIALSKLHKQNLPVKTSYTRLQFRPLEPSPLPEPSAYYGTLSTSDESTEVTGSSSGESYRFRHHSMHPSSLGMKTLQLQSDIESYSEDDMEGDDSDESIDLLASLRLADPSIAAREAEFDRERGKTVKVR